MTSEDNRAEQLEYADKFQAIAQQLAANIITNRLIRTIVGWFETSARAYAKMLREEEPKE